MEDALPAGQFVQAEAISKEYLPCLQIKQDVAPTEELYVPGSQFLHWNLDVAADSCENFPSEQLMQSLMLFAISSSWYVPGGHIEQEEFEIAPIVSPYIPCPHGEHDVA